MALNDRESTRGSNPVPRKGRARFFLCGICNIVSIADHGRESGNNKLNGKEKHFEDECRSDQDATSSQFNVSSNDEGNPELQSFKQGQSLPQGTMFCTRKELNQCASTREAKICWKDSKEISNMIDKYDDVEKLDGAEDGPAQTSSRIFPNVAEQGRLVFRAATPSQSEMATDKKESSEYEERVNNEKRGQQINFVAQDQKIVLKEQVLESFESTQGKGIDKETSLPKLKAVGCGADLSEDIVKTPGSRWKRAVAFKLNAKKNKKMQRDSVTMKEEYELMIKNLTQYGVL